MTKYVITLKLLIGWDLNSWGYHSDDGFLYFGNSQQNIAFEFGYAEGDTVGCGVNFLEKTVFFTLNGDMLGVAFKFLKDTIPLYPAIGLSQAGTEINANFGDQTFLFNIVEYKKRVSGKPLISQPKITWNAGTRNDKVFQVLPDGLSVIASGKISCCLCIFHTISIFFYQCWMMQLAQHRYLLLQNRQGCRMYSRSKTLTAR